MNHPAAEIFRAELIGRPSQANTSSQLQTPKTRLRVSCLMVSLSLLLSTASLCAQEIKPQDDHETILGPASPTDRLAWLAAMKNWRQQERARLNYDGAQYARPELQWGQSSFVQPQTMVEDRFFYDPVAGQYTVERFLARSGSALWWHRLGLALAGLSQHRH